MYMYIYTLSIWAAETYVIHICIHIYIYTYPFSYSLYYYLASIFVDPSLFQVLSVFPLFSQVLCIYINTYTYICVCKYLFIYRLCITLGYLSVRTHLYLRSRMFFSFVFKVVCIYIIRTHNNTCVRIITHNTYTRVYT